MSTKLTIYQGNTTEIRLTGIQNADTLAYITSSTIECTLYTPNGNAVSGVTGVAMTDVANVAGTYNCYLPASVTVAEGSYYMIFNGTAPTGDQFSYLQPVECRIRK